MCISWTNKEIKIVNIHRTTIKILSTISWKHLRRVYTK